VCVHYGKKTLKIEYTPWVYNQPKPTPNGARLPIHKERRAAAGKYSSIGWHTFPHVPFVAGRDRSA